MQPQTYNSEKNTDLSYDNAKSGVSFINVGLNATVSEPYIVHIESKAPVFEHMNESDHKIAAKVLEEIEQGKTKSSEDFFKDLDAFLEEGRG